MFSSGAGHVFCSRRPAWRSCRFPHVTGGRRNLGRVRRFGPEVVGRGPALGWSHPRGGPEPWVAPGNRGRTI